MKNIVVIGSTGSIGRQTLEVIKENQSEYKLNGIVTYSNVHLLEAQAREFLPCFVGIINNQFTAEFIDFAKEHKIILMSGSQAYCESISYGQVICFSTMGIDAIPVIITALKLNKTIALSNKESIVCAGEFIMNEAKNSGLLLPVDSEHNAIFQLIENRRSQLKKIVLTASGGAFFGRTKEELMAVEVSHALYNPNWQMGKKITIDSASLFNKGLEVIEACRLFDVKQEDVDVVIHKQSVVHSLVELTDGSYFALLNNPDMKYPIEYALNYPLRRQNPWGNMDLLKVGQLTFSQVDEKVFKSIKLCRQAISSGGLYPTILNAANEEAVSAFINGRIKFTDIQEVVEKVLNQYTASFDYSVEGIIATNQAVCSYTNNLICQTYN